MRGSRNTLVWGAVLVGAGVLLLLQNVGILRFVEDLIFALLFGGVGVASLVVFSADTEKRWWAAIVGFGALAMAVIIGLEGILPRLADRYGGQLFAGMVGAALLLVYLLQPKRLWALISGGLLASIAAATTLDELLPRSLEDLAVMVFFAGMAGVFAMIYRTSPDPDAPRRWARYAAWGSVGFALLAFVTTGMIGKFVWPAVLIATGGYFLLRNRNGDAKAEAR